MSGIHGGWKRDITSAEDARFGEQIERIRAEEGGRAPRSPAKSSRRKPITGKSRPPNRAARDDVDA